MLRLILLPLLLDLQPTFRKISFRSCELLILNLTKLLNFEIIGTPIKMINKIHLETHQFQVGKFPDLPLHIALLLPPLHKQNLRLLVDQLH